MQKPLLRGLVDGLHSDQVGGGCSLAVATGNSGVNFLQVGMQQRLGSLVLLIADAGKLNTLLGGFDIGHDNTSSGTLFHLCLISGLIQSVL